jgi:hypothetical protein
MRTYLKTPIIVLFTISSFTLFAQEEKSGFNINKKYAPGGAKSYKTNNDFIVDYRSQFDASGIQTRVQFDTQGFWCETITNFTEEQTPEKIKHMVKDVYPGFSILITHKIETNAASVFIVKIENKTQLKTLEIKDGEMKLTGAFVININLSSLGYLRLSAVAYNLIKHEYFAGNSCIVLKKIIIIFKDKFFPYACTLM